jgi:hypothetical protein
MKRPWSTRSCCYSSDEVVGNYVELLVVRSWYCTGNCVAGLKINTKNLRIAVVFERDSNPISPDHKAEALNTSPNYCVILVVTDVLQTAN